MNLFGMMEISGSALRAERMRAEVVAANMANAETTKTADGGPYRRQQVALQAGEGDGFASSLMSTPFGYGHGDGKNVSGGVEVAGVFEDRSAVVQRYDPGHPDADAQGFVSYPDINPLTEMVDLMGATRSYGMNVSALQAEKNMFSASLDILK